MNKSFNNINSELAMSRNINSMYKTTDNYFGWNLSVFPIEKNKNILDLGSGPGTYFYQIMRYSPSLYMATDYSANYVNQINTLFAGRPNCSALQLDLTDPLIVKDLSIYRFDYVFLFDVLEHVKDDRRLLENTRSIIENCGSGIMFLRVPALQFLYGKNDEAIGHYRRYSAKSLRSLLESLDFKVHLLKYQNLPGIFPWYVIGRILKRSLALSSKEGSIFNYIVPALKFAERVIAPPIGLSLYCVCTVKKKESSK